MIKQTLGIILLAAVSAALAACAAPAGAEPLDWNRPFQPMTRVPVFSHDMAIANPPHPQPYYVDYMDEPTRFEFHPRNLMEEPADEGTEEQPAADYGTLDGGGGE
jgi:hypothetical protein